MSLAYVIGSGTAGATSTNYNGSVSLTVQGASNTVDIQQTGASAYTNTTVVALNGSGNNANIVQSATAGNTTVNLQSVGSNNTFSITSKAH